MFGQELQSPRDCHRRGRAGHAPVGYEQGSLGSYLQLAAGSPASQYGSLTVLASSLFLLDPWALTVSTRFHKSKERLHLPYCSLCM